MTGTLLQIAGLVIGLLVAGQLAMLLASAVRRYKFEPRQQELELERLRVQVETAKRLLQKREVEATAWSGYRKFNIDRKVREADNICSFYLKPHDGKAIPGFKPGQFLTFRLNIPGQPKEVIRCYSLSERANPEFYRVTIKKLIRVPGPSRLTPLPSDGRGGPSTGATAGPVCGLVSSYFCDQLKEGDILDVRAPAGHFMLDTARQTPVVFIAGGIGITPLLCMLNEIVESGSRRETHLFLGVASGREHIMKDWLLKIARANEHIHLRVYYSDHAGELEEGRDFIHKGQVTMDVLKRTLPSNNYAFYICGPPGMMKDLTRGLKEWGVPDDHIHFEAFGSESVKQTTTPAPATPAATALTVTFAKSAKSLKWEKRSGSLLELAEANGIAIDCGCRAGNCGTCLTAIKSGEVAYLQETGAQPEPGSCLACVCVPKTDLVLDA
jgi:ferredoxin-NADP reductase